MRRSRAARRPGRSPRQHPARPPAAALRRRQFDLSRKHALYLSYWTDGDTRRRGEVLGRFKSAYRASGFLVDTHGELPDYLPMVLEFAALADLDAGRELLQAYRPSLELLRIALRRDGRARTPACARRPCARRCRVRRRPTAPPCRRWPTPAAHRSSRSGWTPYDPRLLPLQPVGEPLMDVLLWGVLPYVVIVAPGRRDGLAVPLRQVRLDHALVAALRVAAAADRVAAVPLRHPAGAGRPHRRPGHPRVLDRGGRASARASTTSTRCSSAASPGVCTLVGHPHPRLPPAPDRAGLHGHHPQRQADVRPARRRHRARPVDDAGQRRRRLTRPTTTARPSRRGSARSSCCSPTSRPWPRRRSSSTSTRWSGWRCSPLWPFTRLVHAFTAPLHYLFRPYIVYRSRDRADTGSRPSRSGWSPVGTRDRDRR